MSYNSTKKVNRLNLSHTVAVFYLTEPPGGRGGQMYGPHAGVGMLAVADWWLVTGGAVLGVVAAAAAPATTMVRAKMRMASFIEGNLWWI
jgi:hypothetical protein